MHRVRRAALLVAAAMWLAWTVARATQAPLAPRDWLLGYLAVDTSNPPGGEHRAAAFLGRILHAEGLSTRLFVSPGGRVNLYARLGKAAPGAGAIVLLHHMDVVPPGPDWSVDPFGGLQRGGRYWGRGAVDDKSLGIAHLAAFLALHRQPGPTRREVIFLATSDEEAGGGEGVAWLLDRHPELFQHVEAVLTEGGMNRMRAGELRWWGLEVAQKRPLWLRASSVGRGGHASKIDLHSAPHRLVRGLQRLIDRPLAYRVTPEARRFLAAVARAEGRAAPDFESLFEDGRPRRPLPPGLPGYFLDTLQVTRLEAGYRINASPERAMAELDIRLLPDTDLEALLASLRRLAGPDVRLEVLLSAPPVEPSPVDNPVYRCLARGLRPEAPVVPAFIPGITDSRQFRARDIAAYGFSPFLLGSRDLSGIHGRDESLDERTFSDGVHRMVRLLKLCAGTTEGAATPDTPDEARQEEG